MIGATVEPQLADALDRLLRADHGLSDLTPSLAGFYVAGYWAGHAASPELRRVTWEADMWAWCYYNKKSPQHFYRHLTTQLWAEAIA